MNSGWGFPSQPGKDPSTPMETAVVEDIATVCDALINMMPETFRSSRVPCIGRSFCSDRHAVEWQRFITSNVEKLPGYERSLAQATESIRLCAALRRYSAADIVLEAKNVQ